MKRVTLNTEIIKMLLSKNKATMQELGEYLHLRAPAISKYVNNYARCPVHIAEAAAMFFDIELKDIVRESNAEEYIREVKKDAYTYQLFQLWKTFDTKDKLRFLIKAIDFSEEIRKRDGAENN